MSLLELRRKMSRKRMKFKRQDYSKYKKLGEEWRKPRGSHSKQREKIRPHNVVKIGFRGPAAVRGLHPCGLPEVLVFNSKQLEGIKNKVVRIGATVGTRKRIEIIKRAETLKLRILNKGKAQPKAQAKLDKEGGSEKK